MVGLVAPLHERRIAELLQSRHRAAFLSGGVDLIAIRIEDRTAFAVDEIVKRLDGVVRCGALDLPCAGFESFLSGTVAVAVRHNVVQVVRFILRNQDARSISRDRLDCVAGTGERTNDR